jgi:hypothetical protein
MIVDDLSFYSISGSLKKHLKSIESKRVNERYQMLNYYEGLISEMESDIGHYFNSDSLKQVPMLCQNITNKLINSRAICYKKSPQRNVDERFYDYVGNIDKAMLQLERLTYLLGTMGMIVMFDEETQKLEYDMIVEFYPIFKPKESQPSAIVYPLYNQENSKKDKVMYAFWSDENHYLIDQNGDKQSVNEGDVNPFGIVPVVYTHRHPFTTDWFREGATDIVNMNRTVNVMLTEMSLSMRLQMLGQPVLTGIDSDSRLQMGVDKPMLLPDGASFQFASAGGNLQSYVETMRFLVDSVAYNNNLKTKWSIGRDAVSGEALKMSEIDLTESVLGDFENIWRKAERDRFFIERTVLETNGVSISDEYSVDFTEPRFGLSASEERDEWDWLLKNGFASREDWYRHNNPDASDNQIQEMVEADAERQQQLQPPEATPQLNLRGLADGRN